ncbi:DUF2188 domain-containing protein [uncultured Marixanthomonas sp.]|uniref:DUF2188 domain-containing protein n=1 Tax=uncultured Marixanthomonas sp. TaxID=757245 RepID=UPI0030D6FA5C|tara:strand:- start:289757 stop:289990 length:234 start_codon:yes stop_codon:yes gene_type:complete
MSNRKKYHVTQREDGSWQGKKVGGERASFIADTKAEAVQRMSEIGRNQNNTSVRIHKTDGKFQEERTYGNDPHPPDG